MRALFVLVMAGCGRVGFDGTADGGTTADGSVPDAIDPCARDFDRLHLGLTSTIAIEADGSAWGFGANDGYELQYDGPMTAMPVGMDIPPDARAVEINSQIAAYLDSAGALWAWGMGNSPRKSMIGIGPYDRLDLGYSYGCVRRERDRKLEYRGNLANGSDIDVARPSESVLGGLGAVDSFATSAWLTCAIDTSHVLWCWGDNKQGVSGTNTTDLASPITMTKQVPGTNWVQVAMNADAGCAIDTAGQLWCWGAPYYNATTDMTPHLSPVQYGGATDWASVEAAYQHTCARKTTGEVFCWGANDHGELGVAGRDSTDPPVQVPLPISATELVVGGFANCARGAGTPWWCWGGNDHGQLGIGNFENQPVPFARCP